MEITEAVKKIKEYWPDEYYPKLREALQTVIDEVEAIPRTEAAMVVISDEIEKYTKRKNIEKDYADHAESDEAESFHDAKHDQYVVFLATLEKIQHSLKEEGEKQKLG